MPTIVSTIWKRPEYTKRVFDSLSQCHGIEKYRVMLFAEPGCDEVIKIAQDHDFGCKKILTINESRLGCGKNIFQALKSGFEVDDYVIMVEDDIVLAKDALMFFEHCKNDYENDTSVFTVCGYTKNIPTKAMRHAVHHESWFSPWGWATWKSRWPDIKQCLEQNINSETQDRNSWDHYVNFNARNGRSQICPLLARTQNIGAENGQYCPGKEWHEKHVLNEHGAWLFDFDNEPFCDMNDIV